MFRVRQERRTLGTRVSDPLRTGQRRRLSGLEDRPGLVSKNQADWNPDLSELTDAARTKYRTYITRFPIVPAYLYPVSTDEITAAAPPGQRRPAYNHPRGAGGALR